MKRASLLVPFVLIGCAHPTTTPSIDGEAFAPGLYSFDTQRDAVVTGRALEAWEPSVFYPTLPALEPVRSRDDERTREATTPHPTSRGPLAASAWVFFRTYQETWSRADGSTCRFRPSCSGFGLEAMSHHGLLGAAMTFGRLHRNHSAAKHYPSTTPPFLDDPVANYTFSLRTPRLDDFASYDNEAHAWFQHVRATRRRTNR